MSDDEKPTNVLSLVKAREERAERKAESDPGQVATLQGAGEDMCLGFCNFPDEGSARRVLVDFGTKGEQLGLTPDQADSYALELIRYAAAARAMGDKS